MIIPEAIYKAAVSVALLWGWPFFTAALLVGFHGLLRPGEFLKLRRRDLILPCDLLTSTPIAKVRILGSKTKRFLQRQHAKISDVLAVRFLEALYGSSRTEPLFKTSFAAVGTTCCLLVTMSGASLQSASEALVLHGFSRRLRTLGGFNGAADGSKGAPLSTTCRTWRCSSC